MAEFYSHSGARKFCEGPWTLKTGLHQVWTCRARWAMRMNHSRTGGMRIH